MNKQELIDELKKLLAMPSEIQGHNYGLRRAIALAKQLDEPVRPPEPKQLELKKPVVPQFVADWYEKSKDYFEYNLHSLCVDSHERKLQGDLYAWLNKLRNKPIETLVMMHKFGYEVEKEKLYRAKNRHTGEYLCYCFEFFHDKNNSSENQRFTAEEKLWKELGYWGNDLYVFEEAEGGEE